MSKKTRIVSVIDCEESIKQTLASYFLLLNSKLKEKWIIGLDNAPTDVIVLSTHSQKRISNNKAVRITLETSTSQTTSETSNKQRYILNYPLQSSRVINVFNLISKNERHRFANMHSKHSIRNIFSGLLRQLPKMKSKVIKSWNDEKALKKQSHMKKFKTSIASKLLKLKNSKSDTENSLKFVLVGSPNAGKTTAISSANNRKMLTSEVQASDSVSFLKEQTTIGIEYGEYHYDKTQLRIFGTPGQKRYHYVQNKVIENADAYIILIDLSNRFPIDDFLYFKVLVEKTIGEKGVIAVIFTHSDEQHHSKSNLAEKMKSISSKELMTFTIDVRNKDDIRESLREIARVVLSKS